MRRQVTETLRREDSEGTNFY